MARSGGAAATGAHGRRRRRQLEGGILAQDPPLQLLQRLSRLDTELVDERAPRVLVDVERLRLAPRPVERQHQLGAQSLAQRVLGDERLELAGEAAVTSERQVGLDPVLERREVQLLESHDGRLGERLVREVGKSRAAPEAQRLAKTACCAPGITRRGSSSSVRDESLEAVQIQLVGLELDDVAGGTCRDGVGPEHLAQ